MSDPIIEELRERRKQHAARYNNDLKKIVKALQQLEKQSSRRVVHRSPRLILNQAS